MADEISRFFGSDLFEKGLEDMIRRQEQGDFNFPESEEEDKEQSEPTREVDLMDPDTWPICPECEGRHLPMELIYGIIGGEVVPCGDDDLRDVNMSGRQAITIIYALQHLKDTAEEDGLSLSLEGLMKLIRDSFVEGE